jgi:Ras-related protein Rab-1A
VYREQLFRGAIGAFVLFDLTNFQTFSEAEEWIKTIKEYLNGIPMVLIGNKVDLVKKRAVSKAEAENLADQMGLAYIEVSAKDNINVVEAFNLMNSQIYQYSKLKYSSLKPRHFNNNLKPKLNGLNLIN